MPAIPAPTITTLQSTVSSLIVPTVAPGAKTRAGDFVGLGGAGKSRRLPRFQGGEGECSVGATQRRDNTRRRDHHFPGRGARSAPSPHGSDAATFPSLAPATVSLGTPPQTSHCGPAAGGRRLRAVSWWQGPARTSHCSRDAPRPSGTPPSLSRAPCARVGRPASPAGGIPPPRPRACFFCAISERPSRHRPLRMGTCGRPPQGVDQCARVRQPGQRGPRFRALPGAPSRLRVARHRTHQNRAQERFCQVRRWPVDRCRAPRGVERRRTVPRADSRPLTRESLSHTHHSSV